MLTVVGKQTMQGPWHELSVAITTRFSHIIQQPLHSLVLINDHHDITVDMMRVSLYPQVLDKLEAGYRLSKPRVRLNRTIESA